MFDAIVDFQQRAPLYPSCLPKMGHSLWSSLLSSSCQVCLCLQLAHPHLCQPTNTQQMSMGDVALYQFQNPLCAFNILKPNEPVAHAGFSTKRLLGRAYGCIKHLQISTMGNQAAVGQVTHPHIFSYIIKPWQVLFGSTDHFSETLPIFHLSGGSGTLNYIQDGAANMKFVPPQ